MYVCACVCVCVCVCVFFGTTKHYIQCGNENCNHSNRVYGLAASVVRQSSLPFSREETKNPLWGQWGRDRGEGG